MTGPLFFTLHPHRRRARLLLPFTAAIMLGQLACSSDQPTEPTTSIQGQPVVATSGPHPRARLTPASMRAASNKSLVTVQPSVSFSAGQAFSSEGPSVLVLADTDVVATSALAASLADSGVQVTVRPAPEHTWDGTNPSLSGFDVVIHLNGATYDFPLSSGAQSALTNYVANGGGFVASQWNGYEVQAGLSDLSLLGMGYDPSGPEHNCSACNVTYERLPAGDGHPVLAGLPASFTIPADGHDAGPAAGFSTVLMKVSSGGPAVLVREFGSGRVVNFSFAPNYPYDDLGELHDPVTLQDASVQQLYLNAVRWAAGSGVAVAQPQTIDFAPLTGKVYGDPAFSISASASSGLPVNFTATGGCGVLGTTVSITAAGSCTITAHQAGNDEYTPAEDVSQSFDIAKAQSSIGWSPAPLFSGTPLGPSQLNATAIGLGGTPLSGSFLYNPPAGTSFDAGTISLWVRFTPSDPNYAGAEQTVSLTVSGTMSFKGFLKPIKGMPYVNTTIAGGTIPVKFTVGLYRGLRVLQVDSPSSIPVDCPVGAPENPVRPGIGKGGLKSLGYSYNYVWKTDRSWAGTCRKFRLTLADGSTHEALFRFKAKLAPTPTARRITGN